MTRQGGWPSSGFGELLKVQREKAGLSQKELAEKVGCHYMTISELERGTQEPAWPLVIALAAALGVDCTAFHTDTVAAAPEAGSAKPRGRPRKTDASAAAAPVEGAPAPDQPAGAEAKTPAAKKGTRKK